jgi:hypothetical protein
MVQYGESTVFDNVAVVKSQRAMEKKNQHPDPGWWLFYLPAADRFLSYKLDPALAVQFGDSSGVFFSNQNHVYFLKFDAAGEDVPRELFEIPYGFRVRTLCPL